MGPPAIDIRARDIMTTDVVTLGEHDGVAEAAETLLRHRVSNAPVIEADFTRRLLVGFVSEKDLMQCYASGGFYANADLKVADVMRPHPVCVRPEADLFTLAAIFMQHDFRHLPVVTSNILLGMVSRHDVLAALVGHYRAWQELPPAERHVPDLAGVFTPRFVLG